MYRRRDIITTEAREAGHSGECHGKCLYKQEPNYMYVKSLVLCRCALLYMYIVRTPVQGSLVLATHVLHGTRTCAPNPNANPFHKRYLKPLP